MKTRLAVWGMAAALVFAWAPVYAGGPEVGDEAPEVSADEWYNLPSGVKSLKKSHLQGQIVIVEFWATWCGPCKASIPHLAQLHKKYQSRGVVLVALSGESPSDVKDFVKKNNMPYVVGSGAASTGSEYGVEGIPQAFLIAPDGKIAWKGHPAVVLPELERLLKVHPAKQKGFLVETNADAALVKAKKLYKEKKYGEALTAYEELGRDFKGTKPAREARSLLSKMKGNSRIMGIIKAEEAERISSGWLEVARMCVQYGDKEDAAKYYQRILKEYATTKTAVVARTELGSIDEGAYLPKDDDEDEEQDKDSKKTDKKDDKKAKDESDDEDEDEDEEEEEEEEEDEDEDEDEDE